MNYYDQAFLCRIAATLIFFLCIQRLPFRVYLILPFFLTALDGIDSTISIKAGPQALHTFSYKIRDKMADAISYLFAFVIFRIDKEFLYYLMFRVVGIILFGMTRDVKWLVIFPDLLKEYLLYHEVYNGEMSGFPVLIPVKMVFEQYRHYTADPMIAQDPVRLALRKARQVGRESLAL